MRLTPIQRQALIDGAAHPEGRILYGDQTTRSLIRKDLAYDIGSIGYRSMDNPAAPIIAYITDEGRALVTEVCHHGMDPMSCTEGG